jgi:hypothetical protein
VQLTDPSTPASLKQEGNRVIVDFTGVSIAEDAMKRYDVVDFATPVTMFDAIRVGNGVRLVVTASGDFEQLAYQTDNQYVVEVRPRARATAAVSEKEKVYTGERLTLNFQDIDVRPLLQLLADTSGQNIVVSDSVKGRVTLRLQNVPWDQALDIVLKTKGLDMRRKDNVILVAPQAELAAQEKGGARGAEGHPGAGAASHRVPDRELRESDGNRAPREVGGRRLAALDARQRDRGRAHQHAARAGHGGEPRRGPLDGRDARHTGPPGADRIAHRDRLRRLQPRARRPRRLHARLRRRQGPDGGQRQCAGDRLDHGFGPRQPGQHRPAVPGRRPVRPGFRALQREHAGREPGGPHRAVDPRLRRLPDRPRAVGRPERGPRRDQVDPARHHGEPA